MGKAFVLLRAGDVAGGQAILAQIKQRPDLSEAEATQLERVLDSEDRKDKLRRYEEAFQQEKYAEAVALAEKMLEANLDAPTRQEVVRLRQRADEFSRLATALAGLQQGDATARDELAELAEHADNNVVRERASRTLTNLPEPAAVEASG
jgi:hypothetical protein